MANVDESEVHQRVVDRIRAIAEERGITVTHLPDRAAVGRSHFWDVMAGRSSPTLAWLVRVAEALDVDVGDLVAAKRADDAAARKRRRRE